MGSRHVLVLVLVRARARVAKAIKAVSLDSMLVLSISQMMTHHQLLFNISTTSKCLCLFAVVAIDADARAHSAIFHYRVQCRLEREWPKARVVFNEILTTNKGPA